MNKLQFVLAIYFKAECIDVFMFENQNIWEHKAVITFPFNFEFYGSKVILLGKEILEIILGGGKKVIDVTQPNESKG